MYDTSLDKLYPYMAWNLNRPYINKGYLYPMDFQQSYSRDYDRWFVIGKIIKYLKVSDLTFDRINWFGYRSQYFSDNVVVGYKTVRKEKIVYA